MINLGISKDFSVLQLTQAIEIPQTSEIDKSRHEPDLSTLEVMQQAKYRGDFLRRLDFIGIASLKDTLKGIS